MLSPTQITKFRTDGYLVLPDIIPKDILVRLKSEYADLINDLYAGWYKQGLVKTQPQLLGFWEKLLCATKPAVTISSQWTSPCLAIG